MEDQTKTETKKVMIIFYSMFGHVEKLAVEIANGINSVNGVKAEIWRVPETSKIIHSDDYPILTHDKMEEMTKADGFLFGMPTRFGIMPSQMKSFFDSTGGLWAKGGLCGKLAGLFFSTATQGGGQETTALTTITNLAHHGMVYVPLGYSFGSELFSNESVRGGSPWGSGTISNGDQDPSDLEKKVARAQGESFAKYLMRLN